MRMQAPRLGPRVPRGEAAGRGASIVWIAQQLPQRVMPAGTQPLGHRRHVNQPPVLQCTRHGATDMVMIARAQPRLLLHQPAFDLPPRTLGAHPMATGIIPEPCHMPLETGLHVSTQHRRATRPHGPDGAPPVIRPPRVALVDRIAWRQARLQGDLIGLQGLSSAASASF
jgi:hypothetical protein